MKKNVFWKTIAKYELLKCLKTETKKEINISLTEITKEIKEVCIAENLNNS